jgi:hypothetical protein
MTFDVYVWRAPRGVSDDEADGLVRRWQDAGGDPAASPFEPSTEVGWFHRELLQDIPGLDVSSDAVARVHRTPIWLSTDDEAPARVVALRLPEGSSHDVLEAVFGIASKYDLVVFDARSRRVHLPLDEMAAYASATFWPAGAIQAAVAGGLGGAIAVVAWLVGIPFLSGLLMLGGGFMFVGAVYTFAHEGRKAVRARRTGTRSREG